MEKYKECDCCECDSTENVSPIIKKIQELELTINEIERRLNVCCVILRKDKLAPWQCPCCLGEGKRPNGREDGGIRWNKCHACDCKGVIWG